MNDSVIMVFLLALTLCSTRVNGALSCLTAKNRCVARIGCGMALNNFYIACAPVRLGTTDHCTDACLRAVASLVTTEDDTGIDVLNCDCDGGPDCEEMNRRVSKCSTGVMEALENLDTEKVISCSLARMLCEADTKCWTVLSSFEETCSNLWSSHPHSLECSSKCNSSVTALYKHPRAAKLQNCICVDGDPVIEEITCMKMKYNTEMYCLKSGNNMVYSKDKLNKYENYSKDILTNPAALKSSASDRYLKPFMTFLTPFLLLMTI